MPKTERIAVTSTGTQGEIAHGEIERSAWTEADVRKKALRLGGAVLVAAVLMIPIPLVHFVAIPVALLGAPLVFFAVRKLYSGASDIKGRHTLPVVRRDARPPFSDRPLADPRSVSPLPALDCDRSSVILE